MKKTINDFEKDEKERRRKEKAERKARLEDNLSKIDFNSKYELYMSPIESNDHSLCDLVKATIRLDRDGRTIIAECPGYRMAIFQDPSYFLFLMNYEKSIVMVENN